LGIFRDDSGYEALRHELRRSTGEGFLGKKLRGLRLKVEGLKLKVEGLRLKVG